MLLVCQFQNLFLLEDWGKEGKNNQAREGGQDLNETENNLLILQIPVPRATQGLVQTSSTGQTPPPADTDRNKETTNTQRQG